MKFGEPEAEYRDTGIGFGMLGVRGIGSSLRLEINKNNKIITKKQKMFDKRYGNKEININDKNNNNFSRREGGRGPPLSHPLI